MTTRALSVAIGTVTAFRSATETQPRRADALAVAANATVIGNSPLIYKNQGYYVAGSVFEEWISIGAPSSFPPSAHTLADVSYVLLQS